MAKLNFPASPTVGDTYTAPNGAVYTYDGTKWTTPGVESQILPDPSGQNGKYIYSDGVNMIWAAAPQGGTVANLYPEQDATDANGDEYTMMTMPTFFAQSPVLSKASRWQFSVDDPSFNTIVHDTGALLYEPIYRMYNHLDITKSVDPGVVGGNTLIDATSLSDGELYRRVRFQNTANDEWSIWSEPTSFSYFHPYMIDLSMTTPGPSYGHYDKITDTGYYGFTPSTDLIDGPTLSSQLEFTAGAAQNDDAGWLKFYVGPNAVCNTGTDPYIIYVARVALRHTCLRSNINGAGLVDGTRTIVIDGRTYRVRLFTGGMSSPGTGSEWNELMYRMYTDQPEGKSNWDTDIDTQSGNGPYTSVQEEPFRGNHMYRVGTSYIALKPSNYSNLYYKAGWRPVLELVQ